MNLKKLKDKYAIVGIGYTSQGIVKNRSAISFYVEAGINAIKDAGLKKEDIDCLICYRHFNPLLDEPTVTPYLVAQHLGIKPTILSQESFCQRNHFIQAIALLEAGFCKNVLIIYADNAASGKRMFIQEATHTTSYYENEIFGEFGFVADYAMAARRGMFEFGTGPDTWAEIAINQRKWANLNPDAFYYEKPLTYEDYMNSPFIVEPFRKDDAALITDGGRALIITSTERAKDLRNPVVTIMGIGEANPSTDVHQAGFLAGTTGATESGKMAFEMAEITIDDIDACEIYDCFTYTVELTMQDYGFFEKGEGKDFFKNGRTAPGGELPVNTSGGLLSEAYFMGLTPISEGVMQLMERCGKRQVKDVEIILCCDNGGVLQSHSTLILRKF